jgi:4-carboxymuconolactone decarboxylase
MGNGRFEAGLEIRRKVLGAEYVDRALAQADDFTRPLQEYVTECCWGAVWTRPGLTLQERSMITLAALVALGRTHEIKLHVRGALNNGLTREQIREVLLHVAAYAGVPAAVDAFRAAQEVFRET